jgi:hypothetical protein
LSRLFNKAFQEKRAARFYRLRHFDIHRVLLAIVEHEKRVGIDNEITAINTPGDLAIHHRLDGKRSCEVLDYVTPARGMKHEIVTPELASSGK